MTLRNQLGYVFDILFKCSPANVTSFSNSEPSLALQFKKLQVQSLKRDAPFFEMLRHHWLP